MSTTRAAVLETDAPVDGAAVSRLVRARVASRVQARDAGQARPGWVDAPRASRPLAGQLAALHGELFAAGVTRVVVVTAGAVALNAAALVPGEPRLRALDTPDAGRVADVLEGDVDALGVVVSVPPGVDRAGLDAVTAAVQGALRAEGLDPAARTVAVVPPGAPAPPAATVIEGPADVHDAWTAFTPYALVPACLAGADAAMLLDGLLIDDGGEHSYDSPENPSLVLATLLARAPEVELAGLSPAHAELVTALRGPRPVAPPHFGRELLRITDECGSSAIGDGGVHPGGRQGRRRRPGVGVCSGSPTAVLHLLQRAVAAAGVLLGTDPTDPPPAAADLPPLAFADGAVAVHGGGWLEDAANVGDALHALLGVHDGPIALHAHLDPELDASVAVLGDRLARRTGRRVTFTWAPGRPPAGDLVVQITGDVLQDGPATPGPGRDGLRLHLHDRLAGLVTLARAVQDL